MPLNHLRCDSICSAPVSVSMVICFLLSVVMLIVVISSIHIPATVELLAKLVSKLGGFFMLLRASLSLMQYRFGFVVLLACLRSVSFGFC